MKGTLARIATAAVLIPLVVASILWAPTFVVALLVTVVLILALVEFFALAAKSGLGGYRVWTIVCASTMAFLQWAMNGYWGRENGTWRIINLSGGDDRLLFLLGIFVLGCAVAIVFGKRPLAEALASIGISSAAMVCVALPLSFVLRLVAIPGTGKFLLLLTLVLVWVGDTSAYFVGWSFGRLKMAPRLSPGKTWEGAAANLGGSLLSAWVFSTWLPNYSVGQLLGAAAVCNVAGQVGDLVESAYKRSAGVKDSGALLPGHGGILDRIDALIFAASAMWWYLWIITSQNPVLTGR